MALRPLHWLLRSALLFAVAVSAQDSSVVSSNTSTPAGDNYGGIIELQDAQSSNLSRVIPLTNKAVLTGPSPPSWRGNLYLTNDSSAPNIESGDIAYISCNPDDYKGMFTALKVFETAMKATNISAAVFYNTAEAFCSYQGATEQMQEFPIFSMSSTEDSQRVLNSLTELPMSQKYLVAISRTGGSRNGDGSGNGGQNPLGPSPSTAVAMIILYSITGIITALFLVIIITGAVRAHRNPERYGPRDVLGRPRQSRARGIGRAILDTIPIVKFGERDQEPPKPTDVELGPTTEARNVNGGADETRAQEGVTRSSTDAAAPGQTEAARDPVAEHTSGIAPAAAAVVDNEASKDENLGCSICTDDFEKGQDLRVLPCNHKFHPECVDPWLLNVSGTCPLCRVDLRPPQSPTTSDPDATNADDMDGLAPPLHPEAERASHRRSMLRDVLAFRSRPNASAEERISALRRLREQRRNQSGEVASSANASQEDVAALQDRRRSRRISARFHEAFSIRTRRNGVEDGAAPAEASSSNQPARVEEASSSSSSSPPGNGSREDVDRPTRS